MFRHLFLSLLLGLAAFGAAQAPPPAGLPPDLMRRVEHHVRQYIELSPEAKITFGELKPTSGASGSALPGYRALAVTITDQGKTRTTEFLISADGKEMLYVTHFDLASDPYQEVMAKIDLRGRPSRGAGPNAPVTVVVFDDFQCPFCARMYVTLFNLVMSEYRDRVRVVFKDFPVSTDTHPWSMRAAEDANCLLAQKPEAYWVFSDRIHTRLQEMNDKYAAAKAMGTPYAPLDDLATTVAGKLKLDIARLKSCMAGPDRKAIQTSLDEGHALGAGATPTLYVNGEHLEGAYSTEQLRVLLDRALAEPAAR